jgi:hypothetical protein
MATVFISSSGHGSRITDRVAASGGVRREADDAGGFSNARFSQGAFGDPTESGSCHRSLSLVIRVSPLRRSGQGLGGTSKRRTEARRIP